VSLIGHWRGGLGLAGIVACAMFALVCGSSVATIAAIGAIVLPEMVRHGYGHHDPLRRDRPWPVALPARNGDYRRDTRFL
jgi:hypothetical protein